MRVKQGFIRASMHKTFPMFMNRFGLKHGYVKSQPIVIFGCYGTVETRLVERHEAPVIMVWMGSDFAIHGDLAIWDEPQVRHVAIGKWMEEDLTKRGLNYRRVNLIGSPLIDVLKPERLGNCVYCYVPEKRRDYYGGDIIDEVIKRFPEIEFIVHRGLDLPQEQMPDVYRKCFIGLRPVIHDGGAESVIEMGLMGRRTIHNGDIPCSINYKDADDIVHFIKWERYMKYGAANIISSRTSDHIQMTDEWLDLKWWNS